MAFHFRAGAHSATLHTPPGTGPASGDKLVHVKRESVSSWRCLLSIWHIFCTHPTQLSKVVWNISKSCGRPGSAQTLDFLTGWHCVRETDVNSWNRDTCVRFMCCPQEDVWCCLKHFWIDMCYEGAICRAICREMSCSAAFFVCFLLSDF